MAKRETYEHVKEDDLQARVTNYDPEKKVGTLEFVKHRVRLKRAEGDDEVVGSLRLPAKYFVRISYGSLMARKAIREMGGSNTEDYEFSEGEEVWYNSGLLEKLVKDKLRGVEGIEIES